MEWTKGKEKKIEVGASNEGSGKVALINTEPELYFIPKANFSNDSGNLAQEFLSSNKSDACD